MIGPRDRLELPDAVTSVETGLRDDVRGVTLPVNETGRALLSAETLEAMARLAVEKFDAPDALALDDAKLFALDLNRRHLLNVRVRGGLVIVTARWCLAALVLLRHRAVPLWPACRVPLDTSTAGRAAAGAAAASLPSGLGGSTAALGLLAAAGLPLQLALPAAVALALGVALHEAGHAFLLRGVPSFVGRRGLRVAVVHRSLPARRAAAVAVGGPVAGVLLALCTAVVAWSVAVPALAAAAVALVSQPLALTVLAGDGRRACRGW